MEWEFMQTAKMLFIAFLDEKHWENHADHNTFQNSGLRRTTEMLFMKVLALK
jgi:hypothetical protein